MEIKLNGKLGGIALYDMSDHELISQYKWHQTVQGYVRNNKSIKMHILLLQPETGAVIDHINHNKLDNRRENLRIVTVANNAKNKAKRKNVTSKYYGVSYAKADKKFIASFKNEGKDIYIGSFNNEIDAADAFDMYIVHKNIEYKTLNFPDKKTEYLAREYISTIKPKTSEYVGVCKFQNEKYISRIVIDGKQIHLSTSIDPLICARAWDKYIVDNNIPKKKLNFPDEHPNFNPINSIKTSCENIDDDTVKLLIKNGMNALIDKKYYDLIKCYRWYVDTNGYVRTSYKGKIIILHKHLTNTDENQTVDHIDGNKQNNKMDNLRILTVKGNCQNKSKQKNATSQYMGVSWDDY